MIIVVCSGGVIGICGTTRRTGDAILMGIPICATICFWIFSRGKWFSRRTQVLLPSIVDMVCENEFGTKHWLVGGSNLGYTKRSGKAMLSGKWSMNRGFSTSNC